MRYALFALVLCIAIAFLAPFHSWVLMFLCYLVAVLVLVALRVTNKPVQLLATNRSVSPCYASVGQSVIVTVSVKWQTTAGPGWVMVQDTLPVAMKSLTPCSQLTAIGAETATSFHYCITCRQRGFYAIGPLQISVGDLFGIMQTTAKCNDTTYLTIYPRVVTVPSLCIPSNRPIGDNPSQKRIYEDPTRIAGVRKYAAGDSLSRIHWKTTARLGSLMTRLCEPSTSVEMHMLLNLHVDDYPTGGAEVELACTTAASVATSLLQQKHRVGLQSNGMDAIWQLEPQVLHYWTSIRPDKGEQQVADIMSTLGRLQLSGQSSLATYLTYVQSTLPWTASILLITHRLDEASTIVLEDLKRRGFELAVIVVGQGEVADTSRMRAAVLHIPVALVATEKHLEQLTFWQPGRD